HSAALADALEQARGRGCRIQQPAIDTRAAGVAAVLLVIDDRDAMVGTLTPADRAQAVASANPGFVAILGRCFMPQRAGPTRTAESTMTIRETQPLAWLDWEERKQRRLLSVQRENRVS